MSVWDDVHIKQRVEIVVDHNSEKMTFGGIIVRKNDSAVFFPMPSSQHSAAAIKKGVQADVTIYASDKVLNFTTEVGGVQPGSPPQVMIPRPPEESLVTRVNEGTVGVNVELPLEYRIMKDPVTPISDMKKAKTHSLSSDSCIITSFQKTVVGNYIELNIMLPDQTQPVTLVGKISDCVEKKLGNQSYFESYVRFEIIRPGEQDKIVKFVFSKQMSNRRRGLV
jgi:c-di-GMP-binding flagellar brake protein YcgR